MRWLYTSLGLVLIAILCLSVKCSRYRALTSYHPDLQIHRDSLVLDLKGKVKPDFVQGAFQKYGLQSVRMLDKGSNSWLFAFDTLSISPDELKALMQDSQYSEGAEFQIQLSE